MLQRGFTIVEIIITITIMGILMVLAVVNLSNNQMQSRDQERKVDIQAVNTYLENFFRAGGTDTSAGINRYPSLPTGSSWTTSNLQATFPDADLKSFTAPGAASAIVSFIPATNSIQTTAGVTPQPTISQYVYQPLKPDGTLCPNATVDCRKFNLYYRLEADNTVYMVTSKNQ